MKTILTILIYGLSLNTFAQKLVKTYYDYRNTKIQSEYYTDAYGVKNGTYKGYSEYGGILLQGSYKDDAPIGKWTENNMVKISLNKDALYFDDDHLSYYGTLVHKENVASIIKSTLR